MKKLFFVTLTLILFFYVLSYAEKTFFASGSKDKREISLTFDDGPGLNTKEILKILKDKDVKVTFFLLGTSVAKHPLLVKEIFDAGHELANHTYNHINFFKYKEDETEKEKLEEELLSCQDLIKSITGYRTKLVRFPYGYSHENALSVARENNYKVINWSFGADWKTFSSSQEMLDMYLKNCEPGTIFLMHDLPKNSNLTDMLPELIDELKNRKYVFVTVSELLKIKLRQDNKKVEIN